MKGHIFRGHFTNIQEAQRFLTNIVIEIIEVKYFKDLEPHKMENDVYIALSQISVSEGGRSILVMKKNYSDYFDFFQIAKLYFVYEGEVEESFDFKIGDEIKILNGDSPLENGGDYSAVVSGEKIIKIIFKEVKSIYCEASEKFSYSKNCIIPSKKKSK